METLPANIEYKKRKPWFKIVSWCEPWTFRFIDEQECCDSSENSIFDNKEFNWFECADEPTFLVLSADCESFTQMTFSQIATQLWNDVLVKINEQDPCAKYLEDSFWESDYFKFVLGQDGACHILIPDLDVDAIANELTVQKIAGDVPNCTGTTPVALDSDDSIQPQDVPYQLNIYKNGANVEENIECSPYLNPHMRKPRGQMYLFNSATRTVDTWTEPNIYLSNNAIAELDIQWRQRRDVTYAPARMRHKINWSNWYLELETAADWVISFQIPFEINKWFHAIRFWIIAIYPWWLTIPLQQRKEWAWRSPRYSWAAPAEWDLNDKFWDNTSTQVEWYWSDTAFHFSMGRVQTFYTASWSMWAHLPAWTKLVPFMKPSTFMTWDTDAAINWIVSINWLTEWGWGGAQLMHWGMYFDFVCMDDDRDRMYRIKKYWL